MGWIIDITVLAVFSIATGSWIANKLYEHSLFKYEYLREVKVLSIIIIGILSCIYYY